MGMALRKAPAPGWLTATKRIASRQHLWFLRPPTFLRLEGALRPPETDTPDEVQQEAVRRVCGALGMREQFEAAMAAGELLEMLESLPRGAVEASVRLMRGYNRTGEWPEPILTSPTPQRGRSPSPVDEWSDG